MYREQAAVGRLTVEPHNMTVCTIHSTLGMRGAIFKNSAYSLFFHHPGVVLLSHCFSRWKLNYAATAQEREREIVNYEQGFPRYPVRQGMLSSSPSLPCWDFFSTSRV